MKREAKLTTRAGELLAGVDRGLTIERQFKNMAGWVVVSAQDALDAISEGDENWFRVQPGPVRTSVVVAPSVVVYGPQGCGKTRNAKHLLQHFGLNYVRDLSPLTGVRPAYGTLFLTHCPPEELIATGVIDRHFRRAYAFDAAMCAAGVTPA